MTATETFSVSSNGQDSSVNIVNTVAETRLTGREDRLLDLVVHTFDSLEKIIDLFEEALDLSIKGNHFLPDLLTDFVRIGFPFVANLLGNPRDHLVNLGNAPAGRHGAPAGLHDPPQDDHFTLNLGHRPNLGHLGLGLGWKTGKVVEVVCDLILIL